METRDRKTQGKLMDIKKRMYSPKKKNIKKLEKYLLSNNIDIDKDLPIIIKKNN